MKISTPLKLPTIGSMCTCPLWPIGYNSILLACVGSQLHCDCCAGSPGVHTVESCKYAPLFCMLASGKTGEGAYARDHDTSARQPLPTNNRQVQVDA